MANTKRAGNARNSSNTRRVGSSNRSGLGIGEYIADKAYSLIKGNATRGRGTSTPTARRATRRAR